MKEDLLKIIFEALDIGVPLVASLVYFKELFNNKVSWKYYLIVSAVLIITIDNVNIFSPVKMLALAATYLLALSIVSRDLIAKKIYHVIQFSSVYLWWEYSYVLLVKKQHLIDQEDSINGLVTQILIYAVFFLLVVLSMRVIVKKVMKNDFHMTTREYLSVTPIPLFLIVIILVAINGESVTSNIFTMFAIAGINLSYLRMYVYVRKSKEMEMSTIILEQENRYYDELIKDIENSAKQNHDTRNMLLSVQGYINENDINGAKEKLSEILEMRRSSKTVYVNYPSLDALLNTKKEDMDKYGITFHFKFEKEAEINLVEKELDVIAILGNLLDNAIEAVNRIENTNKGCVEIKVTSTKEFFRIIIRNDSLDVKEEEMVFSEKREGRLGIGLRSVKERIVSVGGSFKSNYSKGKFVSIVVIPV